MKMLRGTSGWYYPGLGLIAGTALVIFLVAPGIWIGLVALVAVILISVMGRARKRVEGDRATKEPARIWILGLVSLTVICGVAWYLTVVEGLAWAAWAGGIALFGSFIAIGFLAEGTLVQVPSEEL
jgi:hypothetical protein